MTVIKVNEKPKVVCIGIDAGDKDLIAQWAKEGALPTFRALFDTSAWAVTNAPMGFEASSVLPSFYTGALPDRTGQYNGRVHFSAETYEDRVAYKKRDLTVDPVWACLSRAGKSVCVIDAPYALVEECLNGVQVVDWGTHARSGGSGFETWPPRLARELIARFGSDRIGESDAARRRSAREHRAFREGLIHRIEQKTAMSLDFLGQRDWDFYLTVFGEAHSAGHLCWYLHDRKHPRHDKTLAREVGDPIKDVYVKIDSAVGEILGRVGPDTTAFVFLSHGMGPHYSGSEFLDDILLRLEGDTGSSVREAVGDTLRAIWIRLPHSVRKLLMPLRDPANHALIENNKAQRKYFEVANNYKTGAVRINLAGRERDGMVQPGVEHDALCKQLTEDLLTLTNPATGKPLVSKVCRTKDIYDGPRIHDLPDLLIDWNQDAPIEAAYSWKIGKLKNRHQSARSGDHRPYGMIFARSPAIRPGPMSGKALPVIDLAPTFAALLGVELKGADGHPVPEFCAKAADRAVA